MPDESRVRPQPLQPEELKAVQEYLARFDGPPQLYVNLPAPPPLVQLALDPRRLIATIEEARREQPVSDELERLRKMEARVLEFPESEEPGNPYGKYMLGGIDYILTGEIQVSTAVADNRPPAVSCTVNHPKDWPCAICGREQPVRVTDAMVEAAQAERLAHAVRCIDPEVCVDDFGPHKTWHGCNFNAMKAALEAALAAAPKEGEE